MLSFTERLTSPFTAISTCLKITAHGAGWKKKKKFCVVFTHAVVHSFSFGGYMCLLGNDLRCMAHRGRIRITHRSCTDVAAACEGSWVLLGVGVEL